MPYILLTGASTGIGKATALHLAKNGFTVFAGVRNAQDSAMLQAENLPTLHPIILDVTKAEDIAQTVQMLQETCGDEGLHALINNAGINYIAPFELSDEAKVRQVMEVNVFGMINMSREMLPLLQKNAKQSPKSAKIINIGSIGSAFGLPWEFSYHTSKFAVLGLSQSLRFELEALNIKVVCIMPGGIKTEIFTKSGKTAETSVAEMKGENAAYYTRNLKNMIASVKRYDSLALAPERVALKIEKAIRAQNPRLKILVGLDAKLIHSLVWLGLTSLLKRVFVK
jgi:NAD(P)-dependent dehydrogenase (short-subunit alcohol dehydrogenase family)